MQQTQEQPLSDSPTETPDPPTNVLTSFGNGTSAPSFSPLTPQQKRHKRSLVRAYAEFWRNVNFSRGKKQSLISIVKFFRVQPSVLLS